MCTEETCVVCGKGPWRLSYVYKHLRIAHRWTEDQILLEKNRIKENKSRSISCDLCDEFFGTKRSLKHHKKVDHSSGPVTCPECKESFFSHKELANHCNGMHRVKGQDFSIISGNFGSFAEFEVWKTSLEGTVMVNFSKRSSESLKYGRRHLYICKHARGCGAEINPEEVRKVYGKSKRVHSHCPAFLKVRENAGGGISYYGCSGHLGHLVSVANLRLSQAEEEEIIGFLKLGMNTTSILAKIRREKWNHKLDPNNQQRICYVLMKDILRIAERHNLIHGRSCSDDLQSMEELLEREDIVAHKYVRANDDRGDGFILAFITCSGKRYLDLHGYRGIVFDDTFNVTRYHYRLATLLVADGSGNGFPCALLLSYRMTKVEVSTLFKLIQELIPHFETEFVMTDDCGTFYNAFKDVFSSSKAQKVLCKFHLSQSITRKLKEHLADNDVEKGMLLFHRVLNESLSVEFERSYAAFMPWLATKSEEAVAYMEALYSGRRYEWAPCYRARAPFSTTNHAEAWHRALKYEVLKHKQSSRLDNLIFVITEYCALREITLVSKVLRGTTGSSSRIWKTHQCHKEALYHYADNRDMIFELSRDSWAVLSKTNPEVLYTITISAECYCDRTRNAHCERCGVCSDRMKCLCSESMNPGVPCIHCHAVATFSTSARSQLPTVQHKLAASCCSMPSKNVSTLMIDEDPVADCGINKKSMTSHLEIVADQDSTKEAFQKFQGICSFASDVMRLCLKKK